MEDIVLYSDQQDALGHISVDCVIFGFQNKQLNVLLVKRPILEKVAKWTLPGGAVRKNEDLLDTAKRVLFDMTNIKDIFLKQVKTFGKVQRIPAYRSITVAYCALVNTSQFDLLANNAKISEVKWFPLDEVPSLEIDHNEIINECRLRLQEEAVRKPLGIKLLDTLFPLNHLQYLYEAIFDKKFDNRNFRKKVLKLGMIDVTDKIQENVPHRAGKLYKFNEKKYEELQKKGIYFEI